MKITYPVKNLTRVLLILTAFVLFISCKKEYSLENGNAGLTNGTWQFQNNSQQYIGNIDSAAIRVVGSTKVLTLSGTSLSGGENFKIRLYTTDSFSVSGYLTSLSQNDFRYSTSSKSIFIGDVLAGEFTVNITSLSNNKITGTFSGLVTDSTGTQTQVTLGTFTSSIDLSNNGGTIGPVSEGTLGTTLDSCTGAILGGTYVSGTALNVLNTVTIEVNVTTAGSFNIATNSVNGVDFVKSGTFATTGVQTVVLTGVGTPQAAGVEYFTVTYGTSNCIFQVIFQQGVVPTGDYFPVTIASNWAYGRENGVPSDSIQAQVIPYAPTFGGNVFATIVTENIPPSGNADSAFFRKAANDYITYLDVSNIFQFDAPVFGEYIFLNDASAAGTTLTSPNFNGTISGFPATGYIQATILEKAVPETLDGKDYPDVIKVKYEYFLTVAPGIPLGTEERWFARGVGLIYENLDDTVVYDLNHYVVN